MLGVFAKYITNTSVLRRLLFALVYLPEDLPDRWDLAFSFATGGETESRALSAQQIRVLVENLRS